MESKPGIKTTELAMTGLGLAAMIGVVESAWDSSMSLGAGIALGLTSLAMAAVLITYHKERRKAKGGM